MKLVLFTDKDHIYTTEEGERYESVSGLWKPHAQAFHGDIISEKIAYKELDLKLYNAGKKIHAYESPQFLEYLRSTSKIDSKVISEVAKGHRDTWAAKAQKGTDYHLKMENKVLDDGFCINPFTGTKAPVVKWDIKEGFDNSSCPVDLYKDIPDGFLPELLITDDEAKLAGQADLVWIETIGGVRYVFIDDWKTDREINMKSFFNYKTKSFKMLHYPFNHMFDTNHWKYTLKIGTYAKMLEDLGFVVRNLAFTHVVINDELETLSEKRYILPYKKDEVSRAILLRKESMLDL